MPSGEHTVTETAVRFRHIVINYLVILVTDVGPCLEGFDGIPGYIPANFNEGQERFGVRSVADCRSACQADSSCVRFVFITDTQVVGSVNRVCYLFNSRNAEFIERPGGTVYLRRKCLPLTTCALMPTSRKSRLHCRTRPTPKKYMILPVPTFRQKSYCFDVCRLISW